MTQHWCILGCGRIADAHARRLRSLNASLRLSFASRDAARAEAFRDRHGGVHAFGSYAEAIAATDIDAYLITTVPAEHEHLAVQVCASGRPALVEKPAVPDLAAFDRVTRAAEDGRTRWYVLENYAWRPIVVRLRQILAHGDIGEPVTMFVNATKRQKIEGDWRADPTLAGGGALLEGGIHWIAMLNELGLDIQRWHGRLRGPAGRERSATLLAACGNGAGATLHYSWEVPTPWQGLRISKLYGTAGSVTFESNGLFCLVLGRRRRLWFPVRRDINGYGAMFRELIDAVADGRETRYTTARAREDLAVVESIYRTAT